MNRNNNQLPQLARYTLEDFNESQLFHLNVLYPNLVNDLRAGTPIIINNLDDAIQRTVYTLKNPNNRIRTEQTSGISHQEYPGPSVLDNYIKYRISNYPTGNLANIIKIGKYLILNRNIITEDLLNWSRYFANLMIDQIEVGENNEETISFLGNIPNLYPENVTELAQPPVPRGFTPEFEPSNGDFAASLADIVTMSDSNARYAFPIIFLFVLRSRFGVQGKNYIARLSRIANFIEIYSQTFLKFDLPNDHPFKILMTESTPANNASHSGDRDLLAKFIKLRTNIPTQNIRRISYGLIVQNCVFFGLHNYVIYDRIISKIGTSQSTNLLGAITNFAHIDQTRKFYLLLSMASKYPNDDVWYCVRALDQNLMADWAPRRLNWVMINLAFIHENLIGEQDNTPYTNLIEMDRNTFKPLDYARRDFLNGWIAYWQRHSSTENDGSMPVPQDIENDHQPMEQNQEEENAPNDDELERAMANLQQLD